MILALLGLDAFPYSRSVCGLFLTSKDEMFHHFMYVTHWNNPFSGRHPSPPPCDSHAIADLLLVLFAHKAAFTNLHVCLVGTYLNGPRNRKN